MENKNIAWKALEFKKHAKPAIWYIGFVIMSLGLIAYALYTHNLLTILTFTLLSVVTYFASHQEPRQLAHELTGTGISVGQITYPYRIIKKFWIIYTPENKTLNFQTTAYLNNQISLQLGQMDPLEVRNFLKTYITEDLEQEETLTDIISRKIKF